MFACFFFILLIATINRRGRYYSLIYINKDAPRAICGSHHIFYAKNCSRP